MAGYAAGFSGLESFSPSLSLYLLLFLSIYLSLAVYLSILVPSCSATRGKAGKEIESEKKYTSKDPKEETKGKKKTERKREREISCSWFFGTENARPR